MARPLCTYDPRYYEPASPAAVWPELMTLLETRGAITSCIDVGCGPGYWLAEAKARGVARVLGLDGPHIEPAALRIDAAEFLCRDLTQPLGVDQRFDLCLCLEVAEHIPFGLGPDFIGELTSLSDMIVFSAAIPEQPGEGHGGSRWPDAWAAMFERHGYTCRDSLRMRLWNRADIAWWYRQNLLLFIKRGLRTDLPCTDPLRLVHPEHYLAMHEKYQQRLRRKGGLRGIGKELAVMFRKRLPGRGHNLHG